MKTLLRTLWRRARCDEGQALLEFAFLLPLLLILITGMVDFARLYQQYQLVTDAAREGARVSVIAPENPPSDPAAAETAHTQNIMDAVQRTLQVAAVDGWDSMSGPTENCDALPTSTPTTVEVYSCAWNSARGNESRVALRAPYEFLVLGPFVGWATGDRTVTLSTSFTMRQE